MVVKMKIVLEPRFLGQVHTVGRVNRVRIGGQDVHVGNERAAKHRLEDQND